MTRILIWGKTYPELSNQYRETVCTGGSTEEGLPIRIYPVPLRYLPELHRYSLFDWIEAPIEPSRKDTRPESFRITDPRKLRVVSRLDTKRGWLERRKVILRHPGWRYECLEDLKGAQRRAKVSMGIVRVGEVRSVTLEWRSAEERASHEKKLTELRSRQDVFDAAQKDLQFLPFRIRLSWRCERLEGPEPCPGHTAAVMDWGLGELGRREGAEAAMAKMKWVADLSARDLYLFMGNMKAHPHVFGIVGMFYPGRRDVLRNPIHPSLFDPQRVLAPPPSPDVESQLPLL